MRRIITIAALMLVVASGVSAQGGYIGYTPEYKPMTQQELELSALAGYARQMHNKEQFEKYKELAYERLQVFDYNGFIYYSDHALKYGWYNDKMYYDRGQAYEILHKYRKAMKEYNKAIKEGYYPATKALEQCKENYKRWKKNR